MLFLSTLAMNCFTKVIEDPYKYDKWRRWDTGGVTGGSAWGRWEQSWWHKAALKLKSTFGGQSILTSSLYAFHNWPSPIRVMGFRREASAERAKSTMMWPLIVDKWYTDTLPSLEGPQEAMGDMKPLRPREAARPCSWKHFRRKWARNCSQCSQHVSTASAFLDWALLPVHMYFLI